MAVKAQIGIMQGRLSPPMGEAIQAFPLLRWEEEFALARKAGLTYIEWIFDHEDSANPIAHPEGIARIHALIDETGVHVPCLCADYFLSRPLLDGSAMERKARREKLEFLLSQAAQVGIQRVILPFVDLSQIVDATQREELSLLMKSFLPFLEETGMEIHLETSLPPEAFSELMRNIGSAFLKINYDTGNSASLGYNPEEEFAAYGDRIGSVHLKDRLRGGGTVPLGRGHVDFKRIVRLLKSVSYSGGYTLQVARDEPGNEVAAAIRNVELWREHLHQAEHGSAT